MCKLEEYLGVTLFERNRAHVVLTAEGDKVLRLARNDDETDASCKTRHRPTPTTTAGRALRPQQSSASGVTKSRGKPIQAGFKSTRSRDRNSAVVDALSSAPPDDMAIRIDEVTQRQSKNAAETFPELRIAHRDRVVQAVLLIRSGDRMDKASICAMLAPLGR
jgi:hypothetical protein